MRGLAFLVAPDTLAVGVAILVGVLAGAANLGFRMALDGAHWFFWDFVGGALGARLGHFDGRFWLIPLIPLLGMGIIVVLGRFFPGEIGGYGLPRFLELVNLRGGFLRKRWIALKTIATAVTLGSGMSAGVEGPVVQIGGAVGSGVAQYLGTGAAQLRTLIACGSAASISATFGAPITGVVFAQEVIFLGEYQLRTFGLIVLSSASATVLNHWMAASESHLLVPTYDFPLNHELLLYLGLGLLLGLLAVFYIRAVYGIRDRFRALDAPDWAKPLVGALMVGFAAIVFPWITGNGYETLNGLHASSHWSALLLISIAVMKILATGVTLGAGGSGGVFAPALVVGGTFGGGFAMAANWLRPGLIAHHGTFVLVGMGAMLAAATHAPLTAIFLLMETTRNYEVVLPIMFATVTAVLVARAIEPESIDTLDLANRGIHLHHGHEASVLQSLYVGAFYSREYQKVPMSMPLSDFLHYLPGSRFTYFPVVDDDDRLAGIVSIHDVREVMFEGDVWPLLVVGDVATTAEVVTVTPRDNLHTALHRFTAKGLDQLMVVDSDDPRQVLGFLSRKAILDAYQKSILAREIGSRPPGPDEEPGGGRPT